MMTDNDLLAISELLDTKLQPIKDELCQVKDGQHRLEGGQRKLEKRQANLETRQANLEDRQIHLEDRQIQMEDRQIQMENMQMKLEDRQIQLENRQTRMELILENEVVPRLRTIESCYTDTYEKYAAGIGVAKALQADVDVMKRVIREHSTKLQAL